MAERKPIPRIVLAVIAALISLALMLGVGLTTHILVGVGMAFFVFGAFILQGLVNIPADPPHRGILTFGGKRYPKVLGEGWNFLPLYNVPYIGYGLVLVKIEKANFDLQEQEVRTPDMAAVEIPISVTFQPSEEALIVYEDSGGRDGVIGILTDIIRQELREWAVNLRRPRSKEPATWEDVVKAKDKAVDRLIEAVTGVKPLSRDQRNAIRQGNGTTKHPGLGIVINRLNVGEIKLHGELATAAEQEAKERRQVAGEKRELDFVKDQVKSLTRAGLTPVEARRTVQVAQGKISETIQTKVYGVTPETFGAVGEAVATALGRDGGQAGQRPDSSQRRRRPRKGGEQ